MSEALPIPSWTQAMQEMTVLEQNETKELVTLPQGKKAVGCKWAYTIKLNPNGSLTRLKARLIAKSYSQVYRLHYVNTSSVAKMTFVWILVSLQRHTTGHFISWTLRMSLSMVFLMRNLHEATTSLCCSGGVCEGLQVESHFTV